MIDRHIQFKEFEHLDEIIPSPNEKYLKDILQSFKLGIRIIGDGFKDKNYTGRDYCKEKGIKTYYNPGDHRSSLSGHRKQLKKLTK